MTSLNAAIDILAEEFCDAFKASRDELELPDRLRDALAEVRDSPPRPATPTMMTTRHRRPSPRRAHSRRRSAVVAVAQAGSRARRATGMMTSTKGANPMNESDITLTIPLALLEAMLVRTEKVKQEDAHDLAAELATIIRTYQVL
jgi:hypothetical protein